MHKLCFCIAEYQYMGIVLSTLKWDKGLCRCYAYDTLIMHQQTRTSTDTQYLPPTMPFLKYNTLRSHFVTMVLNIHISYHNV